MIDKIQSKFREVFNSAQPEIVVRAPGRVNFIGEHTDYQEGFVLPGAIERYVYLAASFSGKKEITLYADTFGEYFTTSFTDIKKQKGAFWYSYLLGVAHFLQIPVKGINILIMSNLPAGKGLSSSAALETGAALLFKRLFNIKLNDLETIKICQRAENDFVGVPCGIMDQFISLKGKKNHLLFLDTRSLDFSYYPFPQNASLLVVDTGVKRKLNEVGYEQRKQECETSVKILKKIYPQLKTLRDLPPEPGEWEDFLPRPLRKRVKHVVSENNRVKETCKALKRGDLSRVGELLVESHQSLRDDYQVSCPEADRLVEISLKAEGVYGARMTGAGFGGSIVILCEKNKEETVISHILANYRTPEGEKPFYLKTSLEEGACEL
ncbi:MAG: galactokinase [Caldiserica bacterium]|nr:galactokinase [Caldisericota bacterium]